MPLKTSYKFIPAYFFPSLTRFYDVNHFLGLRKRLHDKAFQLVKLSEDLSILDVGCGTADDLIKLKTLYPRSRLFGIDADPEILKIAVNKINKLGFKISLQAALAEDLPFKTNSFDIIWSSLMIHHLPSVFKQKAFREIYRVLKPKGRFYLIDFSKPNNPLIAKLLFLHKYFEHVRDHYEGRIPSYLSRAGFKQITETKISFIISLIQAVK